MWHKWIYIYINGTWFGPSNTTLASAAMMEIIHHSLVRVTHITLIPCHRIESQIRTRKVSKMCAADRKHGNLKFITGNISNQIGNVGQIACAQLGLTYCLDSVKTDLSLTESTVRTSAAKAPSLQKKELGWLELMPQNLIDTQISQTKHLRTLCHLRTRKKKKKRYWRYREDCAGNGRPKPYSSALSVSMFPVHVSNASNVHLSPVSCPERRQTQQRTQ